MGKIEKGVSCSVTGCKNPAVKSVSRSQLAGSGLEEEHQEGEGRPKGKMGLGPP